MRVWSDPQTTFKNRSIKSTTLLICWKFYISFDDFFFFLSKEIFAAVEDAVFELSLKGCLSDSPGLRHEIFRVAGDGESVMFAANI